MTVTTAVDNFPGFPEGIPGPELMERMRSQAQRFGADTRWETVFAVDLSRRPFLVRTTDDPSGDPDSGTTRDYTAAALIVATGAAARWLGIEGPFKGAGVSTCATCDGHFYRGKPIAVVGGGDTAVEEATFLTRFASKVTLIHRRDQLRASKIMQERLYANPKVEMAWNAVVSEVYGETEPYPLLKGVKLKSTVDGSIRDLPLDGLFVAIGHDPNTAAFRGQLAMTADGYLVNRMALAWNGVATGGVRRRTSRTTGPPRTFRACSRAAMSWTPTIARPSPPLAAAAGRDGLREVAGSQCPLREGRTRLPRGRGWAVPTRPCYLGVCGLSAWMVPAARNDPA